MKTISLLLALAAALLAGAANAQSGEQLLASKGCLGCHGIDEKKMGPALKQAAAKYKGAEAKQIAFGLALLLLMLAGFAGRSG